MGTLIHRESPGGTADMRKVQSDILHRTLTEYRRNSNKGFDHEISHECAKIRDLVC